MNSIATHYVASLNIFNSSEFLIDNQNYIHEEEINITYDDLISLSGEIPEKYSQPKNLTTPLGK